MSQSGASPSRARSLRRASTFAESVLWRHLRARNTGAKFRRQHPFGPYVLDFFCRDARLVVEVDGGQHFTEKGVASDRARSRYLESAGLLVLRFTNRQVLQKTDAVLEEIWAATKGYNPSP